MCKVYNARCLKQLGCDWSVGSLLRSHWSRVTAAAVQGGSAWCVETAPTYAVDYKYTLSHLLTNGVTDSIVIVSATTHTLITITND